MKSFTQKRYFVSRIRLSFLQWTTEFYNLIFAQLWTNLLSTNTCALKK